MIYLRWRVGEPRLVGRTYPPAGQVDGADDIAELECVVCTDPIGLDREYRLVAIGPVDNDEVDRAAEGRWFNAGAALAHVTCTDPLTDAELDHIAAQCVITAPVPDAEP